jgi:hypothetical protein
MAEPRIIVPLAGVPPLTPAEATVAAPTAPQLTNPNNNRVLGSVEVVPIYWGAFWTTTDGIQLTNQLNAFFDFILTSELMDLLTEYGSPTPIGHGSRLRSVTVSDSEPGDATPSGRQVTDLQIQTALKGWIANGPAPATTANTLYFVYLPPNVMCLMGAGASCGTDGNGFCGYHSHINGTVFYAVEPFVTCSGCTADSTSTLDTLTKVSSHELCEAVTDPGLNAWYDRTTGNEIGDICTKGSRGSDSSAFNARLGGFLVQSEWSNGQSTCAIARA